MDMGVGQQLYMDQVMQDTQTSPQTSMSNKLIQSLSTTHLQWSYNPVPATAIFHKAVLGPEWRTAGISLSCPPWRDFYEYKVADTYSR